MSSGDANSLPGKLQGIVDALELLPERNDRIQILMDLAESYSPVPARIASPPYPEENKIPACESEAFLWAEPQDDGSLKFHFAVENRQGVSAKAMAVILDRGLSGIALDEVAKVPTDLPYRVFGNELSMGKSMGLTGMVAMVQGAAKKRLTVGG